MKENGTHSSYGFLAKCLSVILVIALMMKFTVPASAAGTQGKYVRDVIIVSAENYDQAVAKAAEASEKTDDKRPYYVVQEPIYDSGTTRTFLCYSTTNKASLALTSIKAMNMEGGWSYDEYNKYLDGLWEKAGMLVDDMLTAVREYNGNLAANKPNSVYAKSVLDLLYEDDSKQTVSAFFAEAGTEAFSDDVKENEYKKRLTTLVMESNASILCSIENALMLACADSYKGAGSNLFDGMEQNTFLASVNGMAGYTQYDSYAADIINSLPEAQRALTFYKASGHPYTAAMEEMALMQEDSVISEAREKGQDDGKIIAGHEEAMEEIRKQAADEENPLGLDEEQLKAAQDLLAYEKYYNGLTTEEQTMYTTGRMLYAALSECAYLGYKDENDNREYGTLLDLIMKYDLNNPLTPAENYQKSDFYPMIYLMSPGQRAMLKTGFTQFVASVMTPIELLDINKATTLVALNAQTAEGEEITDKDTVSVYYGVDRSLYEKDSGIALTSKAIAESKEKPLGESHDKYEKMDKIATYAMIASGGLFAVTTAVTLGYTAPIYSAFSGAAENYLTYAGIEWAYSTSTVFGETGLEVATVQQFVNASTGEVLVNIGATTTNECEATFAQCLQAFIKLGGLSTVLIVVNLVSIAAFIISLIIKIVALAEVDNMDKPYIDIPRVMCSYQEVFSGKGEDTKEDYMYYYGVKNPLLTAADQARASAAKTDDSPEINILNYGIGDIANWSLHGKNREWVALYASTDKRAGNPILAGSIMVTSDPLAIKNGLVAVQKFNHGDPYDMHTYYGISSALTVEQRYIGYKMEGSQPSAASVFSDVSPIGTLIAGVVAGGVLGTLITYFVTKKRKMSKTK